MFSRFKKPIAITLLTSFVMPIAVLAFLFIQTPVAHAVVPVFETNPVLVETQTGFQAAISKFTGFSAFWVTFLEYVLKIFYEYMKLKLLDYLTKLVIKWVTGGDGPQFIGNWDNFLKDAFDLAFESVIHELDADFLCSPFNLNVKIALQIGVPFAKKAECTLDKVVSNIQNFYNDFRTGGWLAFSASLEPQNNLFGAIILTVEEGNKRALSKQFASAQEALANRGWIGTKKCVQSRGDGSCAQYQITTPGSVLADATARAVTNRFGYIENMQQWYGLIAVIVDSYINKLIGAGDEGLGGAESSTPPPVDCELQPELCNIEPPPQQEPPETHFECVNNACAQVSGGGESQCSVDEDCRGSQ